MDPETKELDKEIIAFIRRYDVKPAGDKAFEGLALRLFRYQFERNSFYKKFCIAEQKTPSDVRGWKEIPAMPAAGFKELVLTSFPIKKAKRTFKTSGTTQEARGAHFFDTLDLYKASILPVFKKYLLPDSARCQFFFLMASPDELPTSSLSYMMGEVNRAFSKPAEGKFYVKKETLLLDKLVNDLSKKKNKSMLLATAFSLKSFLDHLKAKKIFLRLPKGSRLMETGGFKGRQNEISKTELYKACEECLGIPKDHCVSEYGMTELSSQYYDTTLRDKVFKIKRKSFKENPPWLRPVIVDLATGKEAKKGEAGILRHYDLANRGSVMAVETEDLGRVTGNGFELLGRSKGSEMRGCSLSYEALIHG